MRPAAPAPAARAQPRAARPPPAPGEWRTIFAAREPRKTRATGPIELEPTTSTSPSAHSTSSSASSQVSPRPITSSYVVAERRADVALPLRHDRLARPRCPTPAWIGARGRTTNDATRSARADPLGDLRGRDAPADRPSRRRPPSRASPGSAPRQRNPRGASASGIGEECTSRSVTLPRWTYPSAPADRRPEHDQRSRRALGDLEQAGRRRARVVRRRSARPRGSRGRASSSAACATASQLGLVLRVHPRRPGRPRRRDDRRPRAGPRRPSARASPPGPARRAPAPVRREADDEGHCSCPSTEWRMP